MFIKNELNLIDIFIVCKKKLLNNKSLFVKIIIKSKDTKPWISVAIEVYLYLIKDVSKPMLMVM